MGAALRPSISVCDQETTNVPRKPVFICLYACLALFIAEKVNRGDSRKKALSFHHLTERCRRGFLTAPLSQDCVNKNLSPAPFALSSAHAQHD
jgi:hypothetical protein